MTAGNLINLTLFDLLDGFHKSLFIDSVDRDYSLRAYKNNYLIKRVPSIILNHNLGDIKKHRVFGVTLTTTNHNHLRRYYMMRNRLYIWKTYKSIYPEYIQFEKIVTIKERLK